MRHELHVSERRDAALWPWQNTRTNERMISYVFRLAACLQKYELLASLRIRILRAAGIRLGVGSSVGSGVSFISDLLTVGHNVRIGSGSRIDNFAMISIGDWVRLGPEVILETASHTVTSTGPFRRTVGDEEFKPIIIERGCMIYARAIILPGVTIREGCVIGAGSIIDRSTEPNGLYVGDRPRTPMRKYTQ